MVLWVTIRNPASGLVVALSSNSNGAQLHLEVMMMLSLLMTVMILMMMMSMMMMMMSMMLVMMMLVMMLLPRFLLIATGPSSTWR